MLLITIFLSLIPLFKSEILEICQFETMNITCQADQVILLKEARYGRLKIGKCVNIDYGFIGCGMDVLHLLDPVCSGHTYCLIHVPKFRVYTQPCPYDLTSHLTVEFSCVPVIKVLTENCTETSNVIQLPKNQSIYVSISPKELESFSKRTILAQENCVKLFMASDGQAIEASLFSFKQISSKKSPNPTLKSYWGTLNHLQPKSLKHQPICNPLIATLRFDLNKTVANISGCSTYPREHVLFAETSNWLAVEMMANSVPVAANVDQNIGQKRLTDVGAVERDDDDKVIEFTDANNKNESVYLLKIRARNATTEINKKKEAKAIAKIKKNTRLKIDKLLKKLKSLN